VLQSDVLRLKELPATLIHADVDSQEFSENWTRIPWYVRCALLVLAPLFGLYLFLTASRRSLARRKGTEDGEAAVGDLSERHPSLQRALLTSRDEKLIEAVSSIVKTAVLPSTVGIVYGAGHMRVVTDLLMRQFRYRVVESEWLMVIDC
jgi:hypothetical protein